MKTTFSVEITIGPQEEQSLTTFAKEDGKAMIPYLKEKIIEAVKDAWQYNAEVRKVSVTKKP